MTNTTNGAGPEQNHTQECRDMGWWLLHSPDTPCDPVDPEAGYVADEAPDVDHAAALVLNAALDWEAACERGFVTEHMAAADALHKAVRAYRPLVTEQPAALVEGAEGDPFDMHTAGADRDE